MGCACPAVLCEICNSNSAAHFTGVAPGDGTGVAPGDGTGVAPKDGVSSAFPTGKQNGIF